jgi:hypothetical protein
VERPLSPLLYAGFAVACIGGPAALSVQLLPAALGSSVASAGLIALAGGLLALVPVAVWCSYSSRIASDGGLFAFVESAAGRPLAWLWGAVWIFSYALYLPYTVTAVVYDLLPVAFPGIRPYRGWLEVAIPVGLAAALLLAERAVLWAMAISGVLQLAAMAALAVALTAHGGAPASAFAAHGAARPLARASVGVALIYVCGSLPLFLAGEVVGGARTVRRTLIGSTMVVGAFSVAAAAPLAVYAGSTLASLPAPGYTVALEASGRPLADAVLLAAAVSSIGLIVAEFIALTRVFRAMLGVPVAWSARLLAVAFVASDVVSLRDPDRFYDTLARPSLLALFASQAIVFLVYPRFARRALGRLGPVRLAAAAGAAVLMLYGLWTALGAASS